MEKLQKRGIVRNLDELGRIVLPKEMRVKLGWQEKDRIEMLELSDGIILQKSDLRCLLCGSGDDPMTYRGQIICKACCEAISKQL